MRYLLTIITICVIAIASVAQNIEIATETYTIGDSIICQIEYKIKNNNKESIWIWFDKENSQSGLSGESKARQHFMKRINPKKPSPPILQIYMDANTEKAIYSIPDYFITIIPPDGIFTFYIIADNFKRNLIDKEIATFMKSKLCFVNESDIAKFSENLLDDSVYKLFIYKSDAICLEWDVLKTVLSNND